MGNASAIRRGDLFPNHNLPERHYRARYAARDGECDICQEWQPRLCVDHDHQVGRVRGLLCIPCNAGLGHFKDKAVSLRCAAAYLDLCLLYNWFMAEHIVDTCDCCERVLYGLTSDKYHGLLCRGCKQGLASFRYRPSLLTAAAEYMDNHNDW